MHSTPMKIEQVYDLSSCDAVEDISKCPAEYQAQAQRLVARALCSQHVRQPCRYKQRQHDKEVTLPATCLSQEAEGSARIQYINQIQKRADRNLLGMRECIDDHTFGDLIQ